MSRTPAPPLPTARRWPQPARLFLKLHQQTAMRARASKYLRWRGARRCRPLWLRSCPEKISANQRRYAHLSSELPLPLLSRRLLWFLFWHLLLGTCTKSAELAQPGRSAGFAQCGKRVWLKITSYTRLSGMEALGPQEALSMLPRGGWPGKLGFR